MPSGKNVWLTFLTFDLLMILAILYASSARCLNDKHSSSHNIFVLFLYSRFLLASVYTFGDRTHTLINLAMLCLGVIPKFPFVHKFRLFGINKY